MRFYVCLNIKLNIVCGKGGSMKTGVIAVVVVLSLVFVLSVSASEGVQPAQETIVNFDQIKADQLKNIDERIENLQQQKTCVQMAKDQDNLSGCWMKHKAEGKRNRNDMRKGQGLSDRSSQPPLPVK